ncbi:hypothetical protein GCM10009779_66270 [Polymorphospora rubra]|uniref:Uncharacterized protein n=1 Tax=Polymorphospora rubra TaxID=338584 RepID=A0A810MUB8_9ACTN|nr:hypothetical protein Prubr_18270 [Polymorphospora rubra]
MSCPVSFMESLTDTLRICQGLAGRCEPEGCQILSDRQAFATSDKRRLVDAGQAGRANAGQPGSGRTRRAAADGRRGSARRRRPSTPSPGTGHRPRFADLSRVNGVPGGQGGRGACDMFVSQAAGDASGLAHDIDGGCHGRSRPAPWTSHSASAIPAPGTPCQETDADGTGPRTSDVNPVCQGELRPAVHSKSVWQGEFGIEKR